jgi:hypothetical protein
MAKLILDAAAKGLINYNDQPRVIGQSSDPEVIAKVREFLAAGDTMDADGGAIDGDVDVLIRKRLLFVEQRLEIELRLEPEEGDPEG